MSSLSTLGGVRYRRRPWHKPVFEDLYKRRLLQGPESERPRSVWSNWNYSAEVYAFGQRLGEKFSERTLSQAFLHRSYLDSHKTPTEEGVKGSEENSEKSAELEDNTELIERATLRMIHDIHDIHDISPQISPDKIVAALAECNRGEFLVTHIRACLRSQYPRLPEESIRSVSSELTSQSQLALIGSNIGVKDLILSAEFPVSEKTISESFKAVVGALLADQGSHKTAKLVQDLVLAQLIGRDINAWLGISDPMGLLTGVYAEEGRGEPTPRLLFESGATTLEAVYMVGIYSDQVLTGKGYGESVNIAEEMAARDALARHYGTSLDSSPITYNQRIEPSEECYRDSVSVSQYYAQQQLQ